MSLRPNVHTIHPKVYVILVNSILFREDSMHIGTQGKTYIPPSRDASSKSCSLYSAQCLDALTCHHY